MSQTLLIVAVVLSTIASTLLFVSAGAPFGVTLMVATVSSLVALAWFRFLLSAVNKRERFPQTMTALFSVNALFAPMLIPVMPALLPYFQVPPPTEAPPTLPTLVAAAIGFWAIFVQVRIIKAAFESPWIVAFMLVLSEMFVSNFVGAILFGGSAKPA